MCDASSSRGVKRRMEDNVSFSGPPSKSLKATFLGSSVIILELPAGIDTSLPVWDAIRSQQVDVAWTINPYSISFHLTPVTPEQGKTSGKSECLAKTSAPSSIFLQPQTSVIQYITQQQSPSQNTYIQLTFPQNNSQSPATSVMVPLPLIINQQQLAPQPSPPSKTVVPSAIRTPTSTPTKLQAPSKVPATLPFHTKHSSDVSICDGFLRGLCRLGKKCKMHHTPFPFHWQLWRETDQAWVSFPCRSQVLLEKMYCNVHRNLVSIRDGPSCYSLDFDKMNLGDAGVRRLTNSDNMDENPHFSNKWKIYWWSIVCWTQYSQRLSDLLLQKMRSKASECHFTVGLSIYKMDFTTMTQTNLTTGFKRDVRCRPVYRYQQTRIQTDPTDPPAANFGIDPLEDFRSWYPAVWNLSLKEDYSLVDVPAGTQAYRSVHNFFHGCLAETEVEIVSIQQVQNLLHWDKYQRHKVFMQKHIKSKEPLERHLFHGTTKDAAAGICMNNFDPRMAGFNGTAYGHGSYFAPKAATSSTYAVKSGRDELRHMFLAKVLVGKVTIGVRHYRRPPPLDSEARQCGLYDTCVDREDDPSMFVVFDSCQCYPYYLIRYRDLPNEVEI